ncbi:MAG: 50S ribosome-binding GTPase [Candidatus Competibacter sp.]|nr:50S ribosome-binding GTPase [Candidatus Competibacter sp.]MDG4582550.1 50S ribosome-binding GTPase [Candidatus Competibacter sp.]
MKTLFNRFDRLRVLALLLWALPVVALVPLGLFWLWRAEALPWWLLAMVLCSAAGYGLQVWLLRRDRRLLAGAATAPDPRWPPKADGAWAVVEQLAETVKPEDWPLNDGGRLWSLGQTTLDAVARYYHPEEERPLLELTVPHTLSIVERASRDLRATVTDRIPLSHQLKIGDLLHAWRWKDTAERLMNLYRAGRLVVNPLDALLSEAGGRLRGQAYGQAWTEIRRWLLREYVRKVGYYAVALYSGRLTLTEGDPDAKPTPVSRADLARVAEETIGTGEPLRIVVLGRTNAGKSSLINALFGRLTAATDALPDTTMGLRPYRLEREGLTAALIFDTPGCDTEWLGEKALRKAAMESDLILWVCAAHRPDRHLDRLRLDAVRAGFAERPDRRPPPVLVAVSHIDQLRPPREWQPPYDLLNPQGSKATNIRAAVEAVAGDLAVPVETVIPVCLAEDRTYNVDDALWAAMLDQRDGAIKARFLRCLDRRIREENWTLLRRQLANAGRLLLKWPGRAANE